MTEPMPRSVLQDRIMDKVVFEGDCWVWKGARWVRKDTKIEYGKLVLRKTGQTILAHRFFWTELRPRQKLRNLCGNTLCINWEHWTDQPPLKNSPKKDRKRVTECRLCERALRPIGRTVEEFPGTISHAGLGLCNTCKTATMPKLDITLRRVVQERFPKDVWTYFGVEE